MAYKDNFSKWFKKSLIDLEMTQKEFTESIGMNDMYLTHILKGRRSGAKWIPIIQSKIEELKNSKVNNLLKEVI
ncbi:MAG: XRE family transcriptional regulator [Tepidibacter sp.]|jgi:predicted transcriptional regulator|uniref:XRE family transcriptional regulator n=1 Tax=Tepidibacter sp. TaxID=2529387 RepID=UPI0025FD23DE|nr:XRE family transcriptional regulator [Tepidibacter sp.]MCT4507558.1 XRE family transcriptional regulator [Tepidibacter sp.]